MQCRQEVEVTAADGRQGQADEEGEVEEVGEEELEELEDAVEKEEIAEEEEKERAARDAEKERDSQPGPSALQQQQTEGAQQQATLGKEPPGGGAARPGRSGGRPVRVTPHPLPRRPCLPSPGLLGCSYLSPKQLLLPARATLHVLPSCHYWPVLLSILTSEFPCFRIRKRLLPLPGRCRIVHLLISP